MAFAKGQGTRYTLKLFGIESVSFLNGLNLQLRDHDPKLRINGVCAENQ